MCVSHQKCIYERIEISLEVSLHEELAIIQLGGKLYVYEYKLGFKI